MNGVRSLKILIADDSSDDIFLLEQAFKKAGVETQLSHACNGQEAVDYLEGKGPFSDRVAYPLPDVLLLDLNMPHKDGFEVLEWWGQHPELSLLLVYVLSASARHSDVRRAFELHAHGYVVKPSQMADLIKFVAALSQWHQFALVPNQT